eukprot:s5449_g11.t1
MVTTVVSVISANASRKGLPSSATLWVPDGLGDRISDDRFDLFAGFETEHGSETWSGEQLDLGCGLLGLRGCLNLAHGLRRLIVRSLHSRLENWIGFQIVFHRDASQKSGVFFGCCINAVPTASSASSSLSSVL